MKLKEEGDVLGVIFLLIGMFATVILAVSMLIAICKDRVWKQEKCESNYYIVGENNV